MPLRILGFLLSNLVSSKRDALDAICDALRRKKIDFYTASELSDRVQAGRLPEAMEQLMLVINLEKRESATRRAF